MKHYLLVLLVALTLSFGFVILTSPDTISAQQCPGDKDCDGMPDTYEQHPDRQCLNPNENDRDTDGDFDGLTNWDEFGYGTEPCNVDTDDDLMFDRFEVFNDGCLNTFADDANEDPDGDGLSSIDEQSLSTNPCSADTDHDGHNDPVDNCRRTFNPDQKDNDGDGIGDACDDPPPPPGVGGIAELPDIAVLSTKETESEDRNYTPYIVAGIVLGLIITVITVQHIRRRVLH